MTFTNIELDLPHYNTSVYTVTIAF